MKLDMVEVINILTKMSLTMSLELLIGINFSSIKVVKNLLSYFFKQLNDY